MNNLRINICIVHYNTPKLTECLVKSINKFVSNCHIYIFDNSDKEPFIYKQDNITVFDNTKGQIINFDKWLSKFPKKGNVAQADKGRRISARHCISVDKCFDLINDNFILLDSDVLIKKDISCLFDDKYIFCGQLETNNKNISRLTPYLCFINIKKCKEHGVRYFDKERMHGLVTGSGNWYDTGASFYYHANKFQHNIINLDEYIIHYKGASWDPNYINNKNIHGDLNVGEWLYKNRSLFVDEDKIDKVIYTCITGNYEKLYNCSYINPNYDYICFTDNSSNIKGNIWKIKSIPSELKDLSKVKQQRLIKICPHKYLQKYNCSVWIDGSIDIVGDIDKIINISEDNKYVYIPKHPQRDCIYDEVVACIKLKKDILKNTKPQIDKYKLEKFPKHFGLVQSGIIIRKHNNSYCTKLMELWKSEVLRGSHRDQLSFNYCLWKIGDEGFKYLSKDLFDSQYFRWYKKHDRKENMTNTVESYIITNLFSDEDIDKKPLCVFGSMQTERGKEIEQKTLNWLLPVYNVVLVKHDGTQYEYPALHEAQRLSIETGRPVLYLHTRGAINRYNTTIPTRRMWKDQFTIHREKYFSAVKTNDPIVAAPFIDHNGVFRTRYNGFIANTAAWEAIGEIQPNKDRHFFEYLFDGHNVKHIGILLQSNTNNIINIRKYLITHYNK